MIQSSKNNSCKGSQRVKFEQEKNATYESELFKVLLAFETQHEGDDASAVEGEGDKSMMDHQWSQEVL